MENERTSGGHVPDQVVDVVVVGSGAAGMSAALTSAALGADVALLEKAPTVGGTSAVSGGVVWVPAHDRVPGLNLPVSDALAYLRAQSFGQMDEDLVRQFVEAAPKAVDFLEQHSPLRLVLAEGFPDYKPELPGGKPNGGRSLRPVPADLGQLGEWASRLTTFPEDWSNVGFDAETKARYSTQDDVNPGDQKVVGGAALIASLLAGLLDHGVTPQTDSRVVDLLTAEDVVRGVVVEQEGATRRIASRHGVILACGGFEWSRDLVTDFLRGPMTGPVSPPYNTGDGLRLAMKQGAALGNMGEAWWVPVVQIPGDSHDGHQRSRSIRLERTRPGSIVVNQLGNRFMNEAGDYNSMGGPFHYLDPQRGYINNPAWLVFDDAHFQKYGSFGFGIGDEVPEWFHASSDLAELADRIGIDADQFTRTIERWNSMVARGRDDDFGRGSSAYDGWWGDRDAATTAGQTMGLVQRGPFYAVRLTIGSMGTKGGPKTTKDAAVLRADGSVLPGLFAAGNAMAGVTGKAYGGAGGTLAPALTFGHLAAVAALEGS